MMVNTPCQKNCDSPFNVKFLPAHSSFLNPAENAFSSLQTAVKRCLSQPDFTDQLQIFTDKFYSLSVPDLHREVDDKLDKAVAAVAADILESVIRDALAAINREKCFSCHRHSITCLSLYKENIFYIFLVFQYHIFYAFVCIFF